MGRARKLKFRSKPETQQRASYISANLATNTGDSDPNNESSMSLAPVEETPPPEPEMYEWIKRGQ